MADQSDVRRIALSLPEVTEETDHPFAFAVRAGKKDKGFVWAWAERVTPAAVEVDELAELVTDAWRCQAPKKLVKEFDASAG